jgi:hypothetical protein
LKDHDKTPGLLVKNHIEQDDKLTPHSFPVTYYLSAYTGLNATYIPYFEGIIEHAMVVCAGLIIIKQALRKRKSHPVGVASLS